MAPRRGRHSRARAGVVSKATPLDPDERKKTLSFQVGRMSIRAEAAIPVVSGLERHLLRPLASAPEVVKARVNQRYGAGGMEDSILLSNANGVVSKILMAPNRGGAGLMR